MKFALPFKGLISRIRNLALNDPKAWNPGLWNLIGNQTASGENVTPETALTYSAVYNAISLISGTVGSLPLNLKQKRDQKTINKDDIALHRVMHDAWNPYVTAMAGRESMISHILGWGNGYAEIVRNGAGQIVELWGIPPNRVSIEWREDDSDGRMTPTLIYKVQVGNETREMTRERILHVPGLGFDGIFGYSVVSLARKSIGLSMALETFGSTYFGQGTHPGLVVSHPNQLSSEASDNLRRGLVDKYSGLGKSHRLMLLEEGMTLEKIGIPPNDSQFLESREFQIPEIARWFNLPPHKLKDLSKSSFNNIESEQTSFVTDSILPWLIRTEQNYNLQLLTMEQSTRERLYFKHNVDGLLRGSAKDRAAYYRTMWQNGIMTQNEIRRLEDIDPYEDPLADTLWAPLNMAPLGAQPALEDEPPIDVNTVPANRRLNHCYKLIDGGIQDATPEPKSVQA